MSIYSNDKTSWIQYKQYIEYHCKIYKFTSWIIKTILISSLFNFIKSNGVATGSL